MKKKVLFAMTIYTLLGLSAKAEVQFNHIDLSLQKAWQKLLHFTPDQQHLINDSRFYLSPSNKPTLDQEFTLNMIQFTNNSIQYTCLFPARSHFFSIIKNQKPLRCSQVEDWKNKLKAQSLSVVYVTQYISNPASVFGHTFLIANSTNRPKGLNTTINNAADIPPDVSSYDYVIKGLTGGFNSINYFEPLTVKNQEYSAIENRDMWSFDLDLNEQIIDQYLNHIWELNHTAAENYYFLTKNCSTYLVNSLAAVVVDIDFVDPQLTYFMPIESIKILKHHIAQSQFRPSLRSKLSNQIARFSTDQKYQFDQHLSSPENLIISTDVTLLDSLIDYFEFKKSQQNGQLNENQLDQYNRILLQRSKLPVTNLETSLTEPPSPINSFKTSRVALHGTASSSNYDPYISLSPLYHSILQKEDGYIPFSEIILLDTQFHIIEKKVQNLNLFKLTNHPIDQSFDRNFSWTGSLYFENPRLDDQLHLNFNFMIGKTYEFQSLRPYFLFGPTLDLNDRMTYQMEIGSLISFKKMRSCFSVTNYLFHNYDSKQDFTLKINKEISPSVDLEFTTKYEKNFASYGLTMNYFF